MSTNDESLTFEEEQSPSKARPRPQSRGPGQTGSKLSPEVQKARDDVLRQELASVRKVNEAIEGVLASLQKAKTNMKTVNNTVSATSQLLNTWTRILSQTEHNQRLILDPSWQGASQDIADIEEEAQSKQYAVEREEQEEQERKAATARKAEEDEKRRAEAVSRTQSRPTTRGRGRGSARGTSTASTPAGSNTSLLRAPSASRGRTTGIGRSRGVRGKT